MNIDIKRIAKLARLKIEDDKAEKFEKDMADIVDMVNQLPDVTDMDLALDKNNPMELRKDEIESSVSRTEILKNAPSVEAGCFVVPKVVE